MSTERRHNSEYTPSLKSVVLHRLDSLGIKPNERLGQHFLTDEHTLHTVANTVVAGNTVLEVGAGVGQLTELLAEKAPRVTTIEIDRRFEPVLQEIQQTHPNLQVVYGDVLAKRLDTLLPKPERDHGAQIVANLPFHITEPFLHKVTKAPIEDMTLIVGQRLLEEISARSEQSVSFGRLTLLAESYFSTDMLLRIAKQDFFPPPRTDATAIRFTPKEVSELRSSVRSFVFRKLFDTREQNSGVKTILKDALVEYSDEQRTLGKRERNRQSRRSVKMDLRRSVHEYNIYDSRAQQDFTNNAPHQRKIRSVSQLDLPAELLNTPFDRLQNTHLRQLSAALRALD